MEANDRFVCCIRAGYFREKPAVDLLQDSRALLPEDDRTISLELQRRIYDDVRAGILLQVWAGDARPVAPRSGPSLLIPQSRPLALGVPRSGWALQPGALTTRWLYAPGAAPPPTPRATSYAQ